MTAACDASGNRSVTLSQKRFLLSGKGATGAQWQVPLRVRAGSAAASNVLLDTQDQKIAAGRCNEALSLNADAVGITAEYDPATLAENTRLFSRAVDGDRIALLDDQWALVGSGEAPLQSFLALASSMGADRDTRAWQQIVRALAIIEYDERGTPGHQAFAAYARELIKPVADQLRWDAVPAETPDVADLRDTLLRDLSTWGDQATIDEAHRRFAAFVKDPHGVSADAQATLLAIVGQNADAVTFAQLHTLAKGAKDDTFQQRCYAALSRVRDPQLARQVVQIALSDELPPQANTLSLRMIIGLAREHPKLSWDTYIANQNQLLKSVQTEVRPLVIAQQSAGRLLGCGTAGSARGMGAREHSQGSGRRSGARHGDCASLGSAKTGPGQGGGSVPGLGEARRALTFLCNCLLLRRRAAEPWAAAHCGGRRGRHCRCAARFRWRSAWRESRAQRPARRVPRPGRTL